MGVDFEIVQVFCAEQVPIAPGPVPRVHDRRLKMWYDEHFDDAVMVYDHVHALLCRCRFPQHSMRLDDVALFRNICAYLYATS